MISRIALLLLVCVTYSSADVTGSWSGSGITSMVEVGTEVRITMTGPNVGWYAVGFGGNSMATTASAIVIENGAAPYEKVLGSQGRGTDPPAVLTVVSDTVTGTNRVVVVTRPIAGGSGTYTFPTVAGGIGVIWASGAAAYNYHMTTRGAAAFMFVSTDPTAATTGSSGQVFSQQFSLTSLNFDENKFQMVMRCQVGSWCGVGLGSMADGRAITCREPGLCENNRLRLSGPQLEADQKVTATEYSVENGFFTLTATFDEVGSGFVSGAPILWGVGRVTNGNLNKHGDDQRGGQFLATGGTRSVDDERTLRIWLFYIGIGLVYSIGVVSALMYYRYTKNGPDFFSKKLFNSHVGTIISAIVVVMASTMSYFTYYSTEEWWFGTASPALACLVITFYISSGAVGQFVKISRERLITYHRWMGTLFLLLSSIHGIGFLIDSSNKGILDLMWKTDDYKGVAPLYGVLSLGFTFLLFSLSFIRRRWYHIFLYSHWISAVSVLVFSCLHSDEVIIPVAVASGVVVLFAILKFIQPAAVVREKIVSKDGQYTKIQVSIKDQKPCTYGSYYNVGVKGDMFQTHPFSVVKDGSTVDFIIKNMGSGTSTDHIIKNVKEGDTFRLEGPLGVPTVMPEHYERVILCAGGVGVTPLVGIMNVCAASKTDDETEMQSTPGNSESAKIHLHWSCRDAALLELVAPYLNELETESVHTFLYYTGGGEISDIEMPANVTVTSGRPDYSKVFTPGGSLFEETNTDTPVSDVGVFTCGPESMEESVLQAIDSCEFGGSIVVHSETFLM